MPDADVQYRCGSITKTFVAVQVMRLRDEGLLKLSDPLERFIPGVFDGVTIAQLLSHSAGLRAETSRTRGGSAPPGASFTDLVTHSLSPPDLSPPCGALGPTHQAPAAVSTTRTSASPYSAK